MPAVEKPQPGDSITFQIPSQEYLPPTVAVPGKTHLTSEVTLELPSKEYLPPPAKQVQTAEGFFKPPSKEYLPPPSQKQVLDHILPKVKVKLKAPSGEYLPPDGPILHLPNFLPDKYPKKEYHPVKHTIHLPKNVPTFLPQLDPPTKEYLPPPHVTKGLGLKDIIDEFANTIEHDLPDIQKVHLGPDSHLQPFKVPQIEYLPPKSKIHPVHSEEPRVKYEPLSPPSSNYLAPKPHIHATTASPSYEPLSPPSSGYLAPHKKEPPGYLEDPRPTATVLSSPKPTLHSERLQTLVDHPLIKVTSTNDQEGGFNIQISLPDEYKTKLTDRPINDTPPPTYVPKDLPSYNHVEEIGDFVVPHQVNPRRMPTVPPNLLPNRAPKVSPHLLPAPPRAEKLKAPLKLPNGGIPPRFLPEHIPKRHPNLLPSHSTVAPPLVPKYIPAYHSTPKPLIGRIKPPEYKPTYPHKEYKEVNILDYMGKKQYLPTNPLLDMQPPHLDYVAPPANRPKPGLLVGAAKNRYCHQFNFIQYILWCSILFLVKEIIIVMA